jgi:hypothetical protein
VDRCLAATVIAAHDLIDGDVLHATLVRLASLTRAGGRVLLADECKRIDYRELTPAMDETRQSCELGARSRMHGEAQLWSLAREAG